MHINFLLFSSTFTTFFRFISPLSRSKISPPIIVRIFMGPEDVKALIEKGIPDSEAIITGEGCNLNAVVKEIIWIQVMW